MRSLFWIPALLLLLGSLPSQGFAQTGTLTGQVLDNATGLVLPGASITLDGSERGALSDRTGRFLVPGVPAGNVTVRVRYLGYAEESQSVTIPSGDAVSVVFRLTPQAIELQGVEVTGVRDGQARALQQQRTAANITNVVAADQIGRFPDANIGDAMKRIPGFAVAMDQGEARFGLIRGTEPRLNSITLNGERVPSAEGEVREVQLDLIPADMVQSIEVNKAVTPDMDADAIGASVNIVTRQDPPGRRVSATLGSGYNALTGREMALGSFTYGDRLADGRLGIVLSGSAFNHHLGSDNIEAVWDEGDAGPFIEEMDLRRYDVQRLRRSLSASGDYRLSDVSSVNFRVMYNHRDDWENRYRLRYVLDEPGADGIAEGNVRRQTKGGGPDARYTRLEDQRVLTLLAGGEHLLGGRARVDWSAGYGRASEDRPNERYVEWQASDVALRADISDESRPNFTPVDAAQVGADQFGFRRIEWQQSFTEEEDLTARLDVTLPFLGSETRNEVKVGARFRGKEKLRDNSFDRAIPQGGILANLAAGQARDYSRAHLAGNYTYGPFTDRFFLGDLDFGNASQFRIQDRPDEYAAGNYDASETIYAGYLMWDRELTRQLSLVAGVRAEITSVDYSGFEFDEDTDDVRATPTRDDSYTNILPGLHLRYETEGGSVLRAAWTNTISRPNYYDLVPYRIISNEDLVLETGNPDLDATTSMNFDVMAERYFPGVGMISGGAFYKNIDGFIFTYTRRNVVDPVTGQTFSAITQPLNGGGANLFGVEVAFQRQLDFLPGFLSWLGLYTNYTFTDSSVEGLNVEGRDSDDLRLPGSAQHTANLSLSYDYGRLGLRGSWNYSSDYIDPGEIGDSPFFDRYYDTQSIVDLNGTFAFTPQLQLFFEANNLTNQPLQYYQGTRGRMMQTEFYDWRLSTGFKFDMR